MNAVPIDGLRLVPKIFHHTGLRLSQSLHLGQLVQKRRDFILHPLDLDVGQLSTDRFNFSPQTLDPAPILGRDSFWVSHFASQ
jgi:hypothetical protein